MSSVVYWIHHQDHTDMFSEGYIGVSKDTKKRWLDHKHRADNIHLSRAIKKYGWDNLIKEIILVADKTYCLMIESQLRAKNKIGWNIAQGGGMPPLTKWNLGKHLSKEIKAKISASKIGHRHSPEIEAKVSINLIEGGKATRFIKGQIPWNKGIKMKKRISKGAI